jgi:rubrerythrin
MSEKSASEATDDSIVDVEIGTTVYDEAGNELGTVRGLDDVGFYVRSTEGTGRVGLDEARDVFGKAYVMWRCWECGEMGRLAGDLPDSCPACGAAREELYYWAED